MISDSELARLCAARTERATAEDIYFCFRLILGRNPNAEERQGHFARIGEPLTSVVRTFVQSLKFEQRSLRETREADKFELVEMGGFRIYADPTDLDVGRVVIAGEYELHIASILRHFLRAGMVVLDIGANIGVFTLLAAQLVGLGGRVVAVDPNPRNIRLLEASRRANNFSQIELHCLAAAEKDGILVLNRSGSNGTVASPQMTSSHCCALKLSRRSGSTRFSLRTSKLILLK
jgi:FkbM family methyltransferase